jgi:hypothetical protein
VDGILGRRAKPCSTGATVNLLSVENECGMWIQIQPQVDPVPPVATNGPASTVSLSPRIRGHGDPNDTNRRRSSCGSAHGFWHRRIVTKRSRSKFGLRAKCRPAGTLGQFTSCSAFDSRRDKPLRCSPPCQDIVERPAAREQRSEVHRLAEGGCPSVLQVFGKAEQRIVEHPAS